MLHDFDLSSSETYDPTRMSNTRYSGLALGVIKLLVILSAFSLSGCTSAARSIEIEKGTVAAGKLTAEQLLRRADHAWSNRGEEQDRRKALALYQTFHDRHPDDYRILWRLARAYYFWCDYRLGQIRTNEAKKLPYLRKGLAYAEQARELEAHQIEGVFWNGVLLLRLSQIEGVLKGLPRLGRIRALLGQAIARPNAYNAAAHVALAGVEIALQRAGLLWVKGDMAKAIDHLHQAVRLRPRITLSWIFLAEAYRLTDRKSDAYASIRHAIELPPEERLGVWYPDAQTDESRIDKRLAKRLLGTWQTKDK